MDDPGAGVTARELTDQATRDTRVRGAAVSILWVLAAVQAVVGTWALAAPRAFYDGFPLAGHPWVALLPPFNEHLVRDVGALNLGVAVVLAGAALRADRATVRLAATAGLVVAMPHTAFHVLHLAAFPPADAVVQTTGMVLHVVLLAAVLVLGSRVDRR